MILAIFAIVVASAIVLNTLVSRERISFHASMIILAILVIVFLLSFSLWFQAKSSIGLIIKLLPIVAAIYILLWLIADCGASGLISLFQWLNKDTTPIEKEKRKICPACKAENMLGGLFCVKCGKQLLFPTNVIRNLKISRKTATDRKTSEKPGESHKNTS